MTELLHRFYFLKNFVNFLKFVWLRIQPRSIYFLSWWLYLPFLLFYFLAILLLRESGYLSMSQIFFFQSLFCWFNLQPFNIFFYCSLPPPFFFYLHCKNIPEIFLQTSCNNVVQHCWRKLYSGVILCSWSQRPNEHSTLLNSVSIFL